MTLAEFCVALKILRFKTSAERQRSVHLQLSDKERFRGLVYLIKLE